MLYLTCIQHHSFGCTNSYYLYILSIRAGIIDTGPGTEVAAVLLVVPGRRAFPESSQIPLFPPPFSIHTVTLICLLI